MKLSIARFALSFVVLQSLIGQICQAEDEPSALVEATVPYDNGKFEGYLVEPKNVRPNTPALLMVHNWMGLSEETKTQARRFAEKGYIVFLADIYGKGVRPANADEAAKLATQYKADRKLFRENLNKAMQALLSQKNVDAKRVAALGYCFGGTGVLELARSGANAMAFISFHGGLDSPTPTDGKNIKGRVLALHGDIDPYVKPEDIKAFEKEMRKYKVRYELIRYKNAVHSFTEKGAGADVSKGAAYNAPADLASFAKANQVLRKTFAEKPSTH